MLCEEGYIRIHRNKGAEVCHPPKLYKKDLTVFKSLLLPIIIKLRARNIGESIMVDDDSHWVGGFFTATKMTRRFL